MEQSKPQSVPEGPLAEFDTVCQRARAAIDASRIHAISLHDASGDVIWLTEGSMGPDEHNVVREAFDVFSSPTGRPILAYDLGDARSAVLFRAVNSRRTMAGAIMAVIDTKGIPQDADGLARLMTPKMQRVLTEFAVMRQPPADPLLQATAPETAVASATANTAIPVELTLADSMRIPRPAPLPPQAGTPPRPRAPSRTAAPLAVKQPAAAERTTAAPLSTSDPAADIATSTLDSAAPAVAESTSVTGERRHAPRTTSPEIDRLHAALRRSPIALHIQRLMPLIKGSQLKRFEVLLRSPSESAPNAAPQAMLKAAVDHGLGSVIDRRVVSQLIGWLVNNPEAWRAHAVMFSVNLTISSLQDEDFLNFVGLCLAKSGLPKAMIAFEIDVPASVTLSDKVADVAVALDQLGCPLVLDNFSLRTECFDLLRLPAVRYVKLDPEITVRMRSDKHSQAAITAIVQMARVLGLHTVAKRSETPSEQEWLTALGVDFIQSNSMSPALPLDSLIARTP